VADVLYDGFPIDDLSIEAVLWPRPQHLRRSLRYPNEEDIAPDQATTAALDPRRLVELDRTSRIGESVRVIGYAPEAGRVLVVVLIPTDHPPTGTWIGVTARPATRAERRIYRDNQE
jgi:uncharacterized DUF497 family protein